MTTQLADRFGRRIEYLRLSVTDRCDLRCRYCIPHGYSDSDDSKDSALRATFAALLVSVGVIGIVRATRPAAHAGDGLWCLSVPGSSALLWLK